jgi:hypothetical protein
MGGYPKDSDAKKCIQVLQSEFNWTYDANVGKSAHHTAMMLCGEGCRTPVFSTGNNTARALWRFARKCSHGKAPARPQW